MLLAANWKMNLDYEQAKALSAEFAAMSQKTAAKLVVFPPALYADLIQGASEQSAVEWGGQSSHPANDGAHTGDISAPMFASRGASWLLAGHSERRQNHAETDSDIASQIKSALQAGLMPILCVGETEVQRQEGKAIAVVCAQIKAGLAEIEAAQEVAIAYEPVWAIGTGLVAQPADIQDMHQAIFEFMKNELSVSYDPQILYGGSVNASNAGEILHLPYVGGALVGGASLKSDAFQAIIEAAG